MVVIGVAGTMSGVGVTHTCISLGTALKNKGKVAIMGNMAGFGISLGKIGEDAEGDYFEYKGVMYIINPQPIASLRKDGIDFLIMDCGLNVGKLETADYPILVSSGRPWSMADDKVYDGMSTLSSLLGLENSLLFFPFAKEKDQKELKKAFSGGKFVFPMFEGDPLEESHLDISFIKEINNSAYAGHEAEVENIKNEYDAKLSELEAKIKAREEELARKKYDATHDALTGCKNRTAFNSEYETCDAFGVAVFDVNNLKLVNDTLGHNEGDRLIKSVGDEITKHFPDTYRVGGDEFYSLLPTKDPEDALKEIESIVSDYKYGEIEIGIALGFALFFDFESKEDALKSADSKMYEDKRAKKPPKAEIPEELAKILESEEELESFTAQKEKLLEEKARRLAELEEEISKGAEEIESADEALEKQKELRENLQKQVEEAKKEYEGDCIPNAPNAPESAETPEYKLLQSMWFGRVNASFTRYGKYSEFTCYVFPTCFVKPPYRLPIVVVIEQMGEYKTYQGKSVTAFVDKCELKIGANFTKDGDLDISLYGDDEAEFVEKEININKGTLTPRNFGKSVNINNDVGEIFPIRKNINGTFDSLLAIKSGEDEETGEDIFDLSILDGQITMDGKTYNIYLDDSKFRLMP